MMHSTRKTADTIGKKSSTKFVSDKATRAKVCLREQALLLCSREKPSRHVGLQADATVQGSATRSTHSSCPHLASNLVRFYCKYDKEKLSAIKRCLQNFDELEFASDDEVDDREHSEENASLETFSLQRIASLAWHENQDELDDHLTARYGADTSSVVPPSEGKHVYQVHYTRKSRIVAYEEGCFDDCENEEELRNEINQLATRRDVRGASHTVFSSAEGARAWALAKFQELLDTMETTQRPSSAIAEGQPPFIFRTTTPYSLGENFYPARNPTFATPDYDPSKNVEYAFGPGHSAITAIMVRVKPLRVAD
jgi:hypothetical protein